MNRKQFLEELKSHLSPLSSEERSDLLNDYDSHFTFGLQSGKTEEEIVRELGHPSEFAREALGDRYMDPHAIPSSSIDTFRSIFSLVALLFINLSIVIPIGISVWAVWFSLSVSSIVLMLTLFFALLDFLLYQSFIPAKWFLSIGLTGVGILLAIGMYYFGKALLKATTGYIRWNIKTVKGRS